jgi:thermostable 8-oxoguanine DNA glycosylase
MLLIDKHFIETWEPRYDEPGIGANENEYQEICEIISDEVKNSTISKKTFTRILNWKAARVKGLIRWKQFEVYANAISECLSVQDETKLSVLDDCYGIGIPVASTFLHFIYPDEFPIIDYRTVAVLQKTNKIKFKSMSQANYFKYRDAIFGVREDVKPNSLRQIDRAIFAYHKIEYRKKHCV